MNRAERNLAWYAKHHFGTLRRLSFLVCASPALWLLGEWLTHSLGINPLSHLLGFSGRWALAMLLVTLAVTPLRRLSVIVSQRVQARYGKRLSDWNWIIRLRRQFGLFSFFYACLHVALYVGLDAGPDMASLRDDVGERPFILVGLVAFVLLVPLAATSNQFSIRALGRAWKRLHSVSHLIVLLALAHFWLQMKVGSTDPLAESIVLGLLLAARVLSWRLGDRGASGEVSERPAASGTAARTPGGRAAPGDAPAEPALPAHKRGMGHGTGTRQAR